MTTVAPPDSLAVEIERDLLDRHGPMIGGRALCSALGFPSMAAFRQSLTRGRVPVPIFSLPLRRGKFALVKDVACWIAQQRQQAIKKIQ
jgi:hypothetical protein